jgi:hypothetical protein
VGSGLRICFLNNSAGDGGSQGLHFENHWSVITRPSSFISLRCGQINLLAAGLTVSLLGLREKP